MADFTNAVFELLAVGFLCLIMLGGVAVMLEPFSPKAGSRYFAWLGRTFVERPLGALGRFGSRQANRLLTFAGLQAQHLLRWLLVQFWYALRWGFTSLYRSLTSLI
jgi:hypothetical protein